MSDFFVTSKQRQEIRQRAQYKGDVKALSVDFSPWAEDNSDVSTVTWSVESGNAAISSETLTSNVASALITTSEAGHSMIKLLATDGTHTEAVYIHIRARDPQAVGTIPDYDLVRV